MSTLQQQQLNYIERHLIFDIFKYFGEDASLISHRVECSSGLDGFMSALYTVVLDIEIKGQKKQEVVLVKLMRGSKEFRESSKSYTEFANEIFVYAEVLPAYENLLRGSNLCTDVVSEFVPRAYRAEFGIIKDLGSDREAVLALRNLKYDGFGLGPRLVLRKDQLLAMSGVLGPYHALGFATRILQPQVEERLRSGIVPLSFVQDPATNVFRVLYKVAFERFYAFYDRERAQLLQEDNEQDRRFAAALERLREQFFDNPEQLLERMRLQSADAAQPDSHFATILHGDFNRNNVLFHYDGEGVVDGIRMIDFQELRYTTVAFDLSFFMYMNTPAAERAELFGQLLRKYHTKMYEMLELVLLRNSAVLSEEELQRHLAAYSFERLEAHFKRYAFYGAMVCMHFMPWLLGSEQDCDALSKLFESDMHGEAFHQLSMDIAGDVANNEIYKVVRHAFEQGYMDEI